jgi:hypothetical protein
MLRVQLTNARLATRRARVNPSASQPLRMRPSSAQAGGDKGDAGLAATPTQSAAPVGVPLRSRRALAMIVGSLLSVAIGCAKDERRAPPPLPVVPAVPAPMPSAEPPAPPVPAPEKPSSASKAASRAAARAGKAKPSASAAKEPSAQAPQAPAKASPPASVPSPAPSASAPVTAPVRAPAAKTRVVVPSTAHVRVELPSGLQQDLDDDPRMQPWVDKVIAIADSCHAKARGAQGTIEAAVTMHDEARPDVDVRSVSAQLGGLVACATGSLMRTKMPLFTGREGARYVVRLHFQ